MRHLSKQLGALVLAGLYVLIPAAGARAEGWGTVKGQVVWDGDAPKRPQINVDKDKDACLKKGPLFDDRLVINSRNKGVRWCLVYLMSADGFAKPIPVHPRLKAIKDKTVDLDQPCCQFEPHLLAMREGQALWVKNSAEVAHNVNITGGPGQPSLNQVIPSGGKFKLDNIKARYIPMTVKCDIHPWMSGRIAVLKNPYFAVTDADGKFEIKDAPAGDFRIVIWHEEGGWVIADGEKRREGKKITIKDGDTLDLGAIPMKKAAD